MALDSDEEVKEPSTAADSSHSINNDSTAASDQTGGEQLTGFLTKEQVLEQYGDFVDQPKRLNEGYKLRAMLKEMPTRIEVGSDWFILPQKWFDAWEKFCYIDVIEAPLDDPSINLRGVDRKHPGKIAFLDLFETFQDNQI